MPISKINCWGKILEWSIINTDGCQSIKLAYDGLILNGYTHHRVLNKIFWQKMNSLKDYGTVASQICFNFLLVLRRNFSYF